MNFSSIRIITADIARLTDFYEQITNTSLNKYTEDFVELRTPQANLAIASTKTLAMFSNTEIAVPASNRSAIIEFRVQDVDLEFQRLKTFLGDAVLQPPTTMPWGNRSLLFRDPDGNLINFFAPVTEDAKKRFG